MGRRSIAVALHRLMPLAQQVELYGRMQLDNDLHKVRKVARRLKLHLDLPTSPSSFLPSDHELGIVKIIFQ